MDILRFKGYEGTVELDPERGICRGKISLIDDLVTYEASTPSDLQKEFETAVEDYLETCRELGRAPRLPLKSAVGPAATNSDDAKTQLRVNK